MKKEGKIIDFRVAKLRKDLTSNSDLDRRIAEILSDAPRTAAVLAPKSDLPPGNEVLFELVDKLLREHLTATKVFVYYVTEKSAETMSYGMGPLELQLRLSDALTALNKS